MNTNDMTQFANEGDNTYKFESTENENSAESSTEKTEAESTQSDEGEHTQPEIPRPFHEDPKVQDYISRQVEKRATDLEKKQSEEIQKVREEFTRTRTEAKTENIIPSWFGGDQAQWEAYKADQDKAIQQAEERAVQRITEQKTTEQKLVNEATEYFNAQVAAIEADATLNPTGAKIDHNRLMKTAIDNDLTDSSGRWNWKAAYRLMQSQLQVATPPDTTKERKELASATTSEKTPESAKKPYKTSEDFKQKRPW